MSTNIRIPDNMSPWEATINGVQYGPYPAGSVQTVPDEIAALIVGNSTFDPVEDPPETIEEEITRLATQIAEAKIAEATAPAVVRLTYDEEEESWVANKTNEEIAALFEQGKQVLVDFDIPSFAGWGYRAPIGLVGNEIVEDTEYFWYEVQIVDPNTGYLMALVGSGVAGDREWVMYTYPMYQTEGE